MVFDREQKRRMKWLYSKASDPKRRGDDRIEATKQLIEMGDPALPYIAKLPASEHEGVAKLAITHLQGRKDSPQNLKYVLEGAFKGIGHKDKFVSDVSALILKSIARNSEKHRKKIVSTLLKKGKINNRGVITLFYTLVTQEGRKK